MYISLCGSAKLQKGVGSKLPGQRERGWRTCCSPVHPSAVTVGLDLERTSRALKASSNVIWETCMILVLTVVQEILCGLLRKGMSGFTWCLPKRFP